MNTRTRSGRSPKMPEQQLTVWRIFQQDVQRIRQAASDMYNSFLCWMFAFNRFGAMRRVVLFLFFSGLVWTILALLNSPLRVGEGNWFWQFLVALIQPPVLRTLLVLFLSFFIALVFVSRYLDDVFELNDLSTAQHFLLQAAFQGGNEVIRIRNGKVDLDDLESPVIRIGGPGLVDVHLENAALFEQSDGTPHVIAATRYPVALGGFERLRQVIDLRDQVIELAVEGRTKDGIPVRAQDVQFVFSVARGKQNPGPGDSFAQPYPFSPQAIENLVYKQGSGDWVNAMRSMIRSELGQFISQHILSEFLASPSGGTDEAGFVSRDQVTNLFYDFTQGFKERARARGVELQWIGVGTWVTPSQIITNRHVEAWKLSTESQARSSKQTLEQVRRESRLTELLRLVEEIPAEFYTLTSQEVDGQAVVWSLVIEYREKLRNARELYQNQNQPEPPELKRVLRHLDLLGAIRPSGGQGREL